MKRLRIYADTSVIGGCLDEEFAEDSLRLIESVRQSRLVLLLSDIVIRELEDAPEEVCAILPSLPMDMIERVELTEEIFELRDAYMAAGIVGARWANDAAHVAIATVARADAIVSWNFKHIVRLDKMKAYNQINLLKGYGILTIVSPKEVLTDEQENDEEI
jgi:predicted nucleic acid-binding protein